MDNRDLPASSQDSLAEENSKEIRAIESESQSQDLNSSEMSLMDSNQGDEISGTDMEGTETEETKAEGNEKHMLQPKLCLDGATTDEQAPFACHWDQCQLYFRVLGDLTKHLDSHYVYTKGTKCLWRGCWRQGRSFEGGRHMVFHMNSHTGARPYQCPLCEKRFSTVPNYRTHTKNVHSSNVLEFEYIDYDTSCVPYLSLAPVSNNNTGKKYKTLRSLPSPSQPLTRHSSRHSSRQSPQHTPRELPHESDFSNSPSPPTRSSRRGRKPRIMHHAPRSFMATPRLIKRPKSTKPVPTPTPTSIPDIKARLHFLYDQLLALLNSSNHYKASQSLISSIQALEKQCKHTLNKLEPCTAPTSTS